MSAPKSDQGSAVRGISIPRSLALPIALLLWPAFMVVVHGVVPRMVSALTAHHGWTENRPGIWNLSGLIMVVVGGTLLMWTLIWHLVKMPKRLRIELKPPWDFTPPDLVIDGPFTITRHPMYVAVLAVWLGWASFYGSVSVGVVCLIIWMVINLVARREERALETRFGDAYRRYTAAVPRWFGRNRGGAAA